MRMLVTGHRGQLGRALLRAASRRGIEHRGVDLPELDITDRSAVATTLLAYRPDIIVNCAAFTAVDEAESREADALRVNAAAVEALASFANRQGAFLVQISTDYVFDGSSRRPYREDDPPAPISAYGRTKLAGERAAAAAQRHLIVRTAWLFGHGGRNFVEAIRGQLDAGRRELSVVADQEGSPTYAHDLADAIVRLVEAEITGVIHVVNDGRASWFEVAREIVALLGVDAEVVPTTSGASGRPAPRPPFSVLDTALLQEVLGAPLPAWRDALRRYLAESTA